MLILNIQFKGKQSSYARAIKMHFLHVMWYMSNLKYLGITLFSQVSDS